jgi:DNA-binding NarL/FixJ family response regulator
VHSSQLLVAIAEDHEVFRRELMIALERGPSVVVSAEADDASRFGRVVTDFPPDVVCLDVSVLVGGAVDAVRQLSHWLPDSRVLLLVGASDDPGPAILAGAAGSIAKTSAIEHGLAAVCLVAEGHIHLDARGATSLLETTDALTAIGQIELPERHHELLSQLAAARTPFGRTMDDIAPFFAGSDHGLDRTLSEVLGTIRDAWSSFVARNTAEMVEGGGIGHTVHQWTPGAAVDSATR